MTMKHHHIGHKPPHTHFHQARTAQEQFSHEIHLNFAESVILPDIPDNYRQGKNCCIDLISFPCESILPKGVWYVSGIVLELRKHAK